MSLACWGVPATVFAIALVGVVAVLFVLTQRTRKRSRNIKQRELYRASLAADMRAGSTSDFSTAKQYSMDDFRGMNSRQIRGWYKEQRSSATSESVEPSPGEIVDNSAMDYAWSSTDTNSSWTSVTPLSGSSTISRSVSCSELDEIKEARLYLEKILQQQGIRRTRHAGRATPASDSTLSTSSSLSESSSYTYGSDDDAE